MTGEHEVLGMTASLATLRGTTTDGTLPSFAWPDRAADRGYQMMYIDHNGQVICPACANSQAVIAGDVYWVGPNVPCDCGAMIPSVYGDPGDAS